MGKIVAMNMQNLKNHAGKVRDFILDLLFPIECLSCGKEGGWICSRCFDKIAIYDSRFCFGCKQPSYFGKVCAKCKNDYYLNGVLIAADYGEKIVSRLIITYKYKFAKGIAENLAEFLVLFLLNLKNAGFNLNNFLIIPVPLSKKRKRWRGFNQAEKIARPIAEYFKLQLSAGSLLRIKHTIPQVKLSEAERKKNLAGCFGWEGGNLAGKKILLVDDVATTGATLNECAKVLKENGAKEVWGLVVAKG